MGIDTGVIKVDGGENDVQQGFCTFELALEGFNVLGGCISSTVGRLVVGTMGASAKRRAGGQADGRGSKYHSAEGLAVGQQQAGRERGSIP